MGTLTAGQPRLAHYCEHKLPTSCRLSSIGECCACYDNRAHSTTYSTYIDGVGFVSRGTRWQRYCWFCKEFWENRVNAAGLRPSQTRVPHEPDQTAFLERWYEFHQGYRLIRHDDGSEEKVAVLGEDLRDVAPGCLPRTLDELRAGRERSELEEREREDRLQRQALEQQLPTGTGPSLEDTLDQLFQAAAAEETGAEDTGNQLPIPHSIPGEAEATSLNIHAQAMTATGSRNREYQARRIAALRRELQRLRNGIERVKLGLRDLGEDVSDLTEGSARASEPGRTFDTSGIQSTQQDLPATQNDRALVNVQIRVDEAQQRVNEARRNREQAATELDSADQEFRASQARLRQIQNEQRTAENYLRLFGTREEMIAQGDSWESPIGGMFDRAMERARAAEAVRREERTLRRVLEDEEFGSEDVARRLAELESHELDVWGVPRLRNASSTLPSSDDAGVQQVTTTQYRSPDASTRAPIQGRFGTPETESDLRGHEVGLEEYYNLLRRQNWSQQDAVTTAHQEDAVERNPQEIVSENQAEASSRPEEAEVSVVAGPPGQQLDEDPFADNDRGLDAVFLLSKLSASEELRSFLPWANLDTVRRLLQNTESNNLTWADRENIESILATLDVVWGAQLPAERNRRRRERGETVAFTADAHGMALQGIVPVHDIEIMAECFQMSRRVRGQSGIIAPEQLIMLYRLQRGERRSEDRAVLTRMLQSDIALTRAREVHEQHYSEPNAEESNRHAMLESDRRTAARQGDHSRAELDAQRRATRNVALAAGRAAMAIGPRELLQRMANRDEETRAAYQRMEENGFAAAESMTNRQLRGPFYRAVNLNDFAASPVASDSDDSNPDARGLDAKDSGRPEEPLTEEQMTVLLDCRICYTQKASITTIPCGHLAMCEWCSEQHSPTMVHDRSRPQRAAACPVCRKHIRQKIKVIRA